MNEKMTQSLEEKLPKGRLLVGRFLLVSTIIMNLFIGIQLNIIQLILWFSIKLSSNRRWQWHHHQLQGFTHRILAAPMLFILFHWNHLKLRVLFPEKHLLADIETEGVGLFVGNHPQQLDLLFGCTIAELYCKFDSFRTIIIESFGLVPIFGWSCWLNGMAIIRRHWQTDLPRLGRYLDQAPGFRQLMLLFLPEGHRWTLIKQRKSDEFMRANGRQPFEFHLAPRPRGFKATLRHLLRQPREVRDDIWKPVRVLNGQLLSRKRYSIQHLIRGEPIELDLVFEEFHLNDEIRQEARNSQNIDDCPLISQLLDTIFRRKDQLTRDYMTLTKEEFSDRHAAEGLVMEPKPGSFSTVVWCFGMIYMNSLLVWLATEIGWLSPYACLPALIFSIMIHYTMRRASRDEGLFENELKDNQVSSDESSVAFSSHQAASVADRPQSVGSDTITTHAD